MKKNQPRQRFPRRKAPRRPVSALTVSLARKPWRMKIEIGGVEFEAETPGAWFALGGAVYDVDADGKARCVGVIR